MRVCPWCCDQATTSLLSWRIFICYIFIVQAHERVSLVEEKEFITSYFQLHKRENGFGNSKSYPWNVQSLQWTQWRLCWGSHYSLLLNDFSNVNWIRQKTKLLLMNWAPTQTRAEKNSFIHTRLVNFIRSNAMLCWITSQDSMDSEQRQFCVLFTLP